MNIPLRFAWALAALSLFPASAAALSQGKHRDLSTSACWKHKLPSEFCASVGAAAYNVDHFEWDDLSAHAQPEVGESKCQAANKAASRIRTLAQEVRSISKASTDYDPALAVALGRALHTIQDNCAHAGMPNPEHAWFSVSDSCTDSESSPDVQPEAIACAEQETAQALQMFADTIQVPTPPPSSDQPGSPSNQDPQYWPHRGDVCDFLKSATSWDGVARRWNGPVVVAALRDQLYTTLVVDPTAPALDVCAAGEAALESGTQPPNVDTSHPAEWCGLLQLYCAGKADSADAPPPWDESPSKPSEGSAESSGCSLSSSSSSSAAGLLGLALAALLARSRRRARCRRM